MILNWMFPPFFLKVFKHGVGPGRSVDLTRLNGYEELVQKLDGMFGFGGSLADGSSGWQVTYTDNEGDLMLIGDILWQLSTNKPYDIAVLFRYRHFLYMV